jgi:hypothetical protein
MPTFLPFVRPVKAPPASLVVCALIIGLGANCLPSATPRTNPSPGAESRPLANDSVAQPAPSSAVHELDAPTPDAGILGGENPVLLPLISVDLPYPVDARPRAQDPVQAAADDAELARWDVGSSSDPNSVSSQASYHPGTRVVIDTRPAKRRAGAPALPAPRGLTYQRVQAQARSHGYWPLRLCFELGQREKKGAGGETRVAFTIGTRGKVSAARLLDSELASASSAACMVRAVQKLVFKPAPTNKLSMVASIQIYPGDAEQPLVADAAVVAALPRGQFDPEAVRARVTAKQIELDACFAEARRADPGLWGRLALSVILELDGSVHRVTEAESHFPSAAATRCVQILVSSLVFPSVNGKPFSFVLPLRLSPSAALAKTGPDENPSPSEVSDEVAPD